MVEPRLSVLFLCTGNSARSQMAEAILRHMSHQQIDVESAGTAPQPDIHPMARRAVRTLLNLDMAGQYPKSLDRFVHQDFDYVITVCDRAAETCPTFPGDPERIHWSFDDPAAVVASDDARQRAFDSTAKQLVSRIRLWLSLPVINKRIHLNPSLAQ
jgi:ArsR family transcriptional regulator, arsenate/arsenite/antimonite-responsive transcriptional repressor / arsenate reductase (thioredoxin)